MSEAASNPKSEHPFSDKAREKAQHAADSACHATSDAAVHYVREPANDLLVIARDYAREKPDVAALWCFALGVIVGWKMKP